MLPKEYLLATPSETPLPDTIRPPSVYILKKEYGYEGDEILGVFSSEEDAKGAFSRVNVNSRQWVHLYEITLDELYEDGI
jgi:hypothetical protein